MHRRSSAGRAAWTRSFRRGLFRIVGASNRRTRPRTPAEGAGAPSIEASDGEVTASVRAPRDTDHGSLLRRALHVAAALALATGLTGTAVMGHRFLTRSPRFAVREVRLPSLPHVPEAALRAALALPEGENLFAADLSAATRRLRRNPWIAEARVYRVLPDTLVVEASEREPAALVALGPLYLCDARGEVWKRAALGEVAGLPVITGLTRDGYVQDREHEVALLREGLAALAAWRTVERPPAGEVHVDRGAGATLYTVDGLGVRIGRGDAAALAERLLRADVVRETFVGKDARPELILVDQASRPDRVTVRLASR